MLADEIDHARIPVRIPEDFLNGLRCEQARVLGPGPSQPFNDVAGRLLERQERKLAVTDHPLAQLSQPAPMQFLLEQRLSGQYDLHNFDAATLQIEQHAHFFECRARERLGFINQYHRAITQVLTLQQPSCKGAQQLALGSGITSYSEILKDESQQVLGGEKSVENIGCRITVLLLKPFEEVTKNGGFARPRLTGKNHQALSRFDSEDELQQCLIMPRRRVEAL